VGELERGATFFIEVVEERTSTPIVRIIYRKNLMMKFLTNHLK
jgi:hypothetical protein